MSRRFDDERTSEVIRKYIQHRTKLEAWYAKGSWWRKWPLLSLHSRWHEERLRDFWKSAYETLLARHEGLLIEVHNLARRSGPEDALDIDSLGFRWIDCVREDTRGKAESAFPLILWGCARRQIEENFQHPALAAIEPLKQKFLLRSLVDDLGDDRLRRVLTLLAYTPIVGSVGRRSRITREDLSLLREACKAVNSVIESRPDIADATEGAIRPATSVEEALRWFFPEI